MRFVLREGRRLLDHLEKKHLRLPCLRLGGKSGVPRGHGILQDLIPRYSQQPSPLFELLTGPEENPVNWPEKQQKAFLRGQD